MKFLDFFERFFLKFDLYGHRVDLYIGSRAVVRSKFGAFVSVMILAVAAYSLSNNFSSWSTNQNLTTIQSAQSLNVLDLISNNVSYKYFHDYNNYNIQFGANLQLYDGTYISISSLQRYFKQTMLYNDGSNFYSLEYENCFSNKTKAFLLQENDNDNGTSSFFCLKYSEPLEMGLITNKTEKKINSPTVVYLIHKCSNSTENNFTCASDEDIEYIIKSMMVQLNIPNTLYDFKDVQSPRKRTYNTKKYHLDFSISKVYYGSLITNYLYTDQGVFYEDFQLDSIDFNLDSLDYEFMVRNPDKSNLLFQFYYNFGFNQQIYYRKNDKLYSIVANFGGILNILFLFGQIVCYSYNLLVLKHKLINISFANLENKGK